MKNNEIIFEPKAKKWLVEEPNFDNCCVDEILSGNRFVTQNNVVVQVEHLTSPPKNRQGFLQSKKNLEAILRKNTKVKIIPKGNTRDGTMIAQVIAKGGDVAEIYEKRFNDEEKSKNIFKSSQERIKWHKKYLK